VSAAFGERPPRDRTIADMSLTCLQVSRDMGNHSMVELCKRVLSQLRTNKSPRLGDIRAISQTLNQYFR
jgi:hypothetical protein